MTAHRRTPWSAAADGPTAVLSNSLGSTHRKYNAQLADIEQRFRVVRYDTPRPPCVPRFRSTPREDTSPPGSRCSTRREQTSGPAESG